MPVPIYNIGDQVYVSGMGSGYIAGDIHYRPYQTKNTGVQKIERVYLVLFENPTPHVAYASQIRYQRPATTESITLIQTHILNMFSPDTNIINPDSICWTGQLGVGSKVVHYKYGHGIIISDGYHRPDMYDDKVYYHVYYPETEIFALQRLYEFNFDDVATNDSRQEAHQILLKKIFDPVFSAQKE